MCLPFYSASIPPPNDKCRSFVSRIKILLYIQLVIGIIKILFLSSTSSSSDGILDLFGCCALYLAYSQINHIGCVLYIFLSLYSFINEFVIIGTYVQDGVKLFGVSSTANFYMIVIFFSIIFYIVAIYFVFQSYKEFKAVNIEGLLQQPGLGGGYFDQEDDQDYYPQQQQYNQPQPQNQNQNQVQPQPRPQMQAPSNQTQNSQSPVRNVQMATSNNNNNDSNRQGGFKAFAGSGVKVGGN